MLNAASFDVLRFLIGIICNINGKCILRKILFVYLVGSVEWDQAKRLKF